MIGNSGKTPVSLVVQAACCGSRSRELLLLICVTDIRYQGRPLVKVTRNRLKTLSRESETCGQEEQNELKRNEKLQGTRENSPQCRKVQPSVVFGPIIV